MRSALATRVAAVAVLLCALVLVVTPVRAQSEPTVTLTPSFDTAGAAPSTWSITVSGTGWGGARVFVSFAGGATASATPTNGSWSTKLTTDRRGPGAYTVAASQDNCSPRAAPCPYTITRTFRSLLVTLDPPCRKPVAARLLVTAQGFTPQSYGYVYFDYPSGPELDSVQRIPTGDGTFRAPFDTNASGRAVTIFVRDLDGPNQTLTWPACPPDATTTSTTTVVDETTTSTTRPLIGSTTTTSTTIPTIVSIPPPTPGASLVLTPSVGPGGFVATARGSGFPADQPVTLGWSPGLGIFQVTASATGEFTLPALIMNRDIIGPRTLVATSGTTSASAAFLVVQSTVQPSGKDVAQISRIRRFLSR